MGPQTVRDVVRRFHGVASDLRLRDSGASHVGVRSCRILLSERKYSADSQTNSSSSSFFFGSKLLSRGEVVLEHRLGPPRSIDRGPDSASDVFSGGPDAGDLVLLVHLSLNHVATGVHSSKCGDRQSTYAHIRRDATAGPSGHWLRVAAKATPPTHTREGLSSRRGHTTGPLWIPSRPPEGVSSEC